MLPVLLVGFCFVQGDFKGEIEVVKTLPYRAGNGTVLVRRVKGFAPLFYQSKMSNDVDGAPNAYHPLDDRLALDVIAAGEGKREGGRPDGKLIKLPSSDIVAYVKGKPYVQPSGPYKGFYVAMTAKSNGGTPTDPASYIDARKIQYVVIPGKGLPGVQPGDLALVWDPKRESALFCVAGDVGPGDECGEASLATIQAWDPSIKDGRSSPFEARKDIAFVFFPGTHKALSRKGWPYRQVNINVLAEKELKAWGGYARLRQLFHSN